MTGGNLLGNQHHHHIDDDDNDMMICILEERCHGRLVIRMMPEKMTIYNLQIVFNFFLQKSEDLFREFPMV